ncbi:polysaccharide biosynthesis/export family protein [Sulfitobacter sp. R18_1]|uniref:polysaccharide biosynthesis/export family protein n=1 Tax=Sulfitobacter sp. R18_1 TaxID=2821104 RepID=UPI001ADBE7F3|nr:polysaccharide biosynthesis/export family protein [Sulfitobacter sp. R18_1]MBO9428598.1 polysaccharide biosynthesis/export family protein [Sulfitobacter sp. R18_1]
MNIIMKVFLITMGVIFMSVKGVFANPVEEQVIAPFGASIFEAPSSSNAAAITDPYRQIGYGDRLLVRMWGGTEYEQILMVDAEGRIFIPQVGPVLVAGKPLSDAQQSIKSAVGKIYKDNVSVHATLAEINPISVFVTGNVVFPGRYEGSQSDTILDYIVRAGGIRPLSGSYRDIKIKRATYVEAEYDFYDFILNGDMLEYDFRHGDTIVVGDKDFSVSVSGGAQNDNIFEFLSDDIDGADILDRARPDNGISHAMVTRTTGVNDKDIYLTLEDFASFDMADGDLVTFRRDTVSDTISVRIDGEVAGQKTYSLKKGASLKQLLSFVAVDAKIVNLKAVHIERPSVAIEQKKALEQNLMRLQQAALTQRSASGSQAQIRAAEADMITAFTQSAREAEFSGKVTISRHGEVSDIVLQDGDTIIVPRKSDVVLVSGEVLMTNAILYEPGLRVKDYVAMSGGLTNNSDPDRFVINHQDGSSSIASADTKVKNGDQILAMPKVDNKNLALAKDVVGIMYQIAMGTRAIVSP